MLTKEGTKSLHPDGFALATCKHVPTVAYPFNLLFSIKAKPLLCVLTQPGEFLTISSKMATSLANHGLSAQFSSRL
eukprot:2350052-Amphidinium_carterae.1